MVFIMAGLLCNVDQCKNVASQRLPLGRRSSFQDVFRTGPRRGPTNRAKCARNTPRRPRRGSEEHSVPKEKRATTQRPIGEKRSMVVWLGSWCSSNVRPFFGRSFWVAGAPGLPSSLLVCVCWVLPGSSSRLLAFLSLYRRRKSFRYPQLFVGTTPYVLLIYDVHFVPMELEEKVRYCTFHQKVPSSALWFRALKVEALAGWTHLSCVRLSTPSYAQRRHRACSWCDDCREERIGVRVRQGLTLSPWSWCSGVICRM